MKLLYFDCPSGISGDMVVGALLDAGLSIEALRRELAKLKLCGFKIFKNKVRRGELVGTKFGVRDTGAHLHRSFKEIMKLISESKLNKNVETSAKRIFQNLADAEKSSHGVKGGDVHFHQLGEIDSIIDIVAACIGFDALGIDKFYSSPVASGRGVIADKYGVLPNPCPAALGLLVGGKIRFKDIPYELVTPTGAAILKTFCNGFRTVPVMKIEKIGYGAGDRVYPGMLNLLRIIIGKAE